MYEALTVLAGKFEIIVRKPRREYVAEIWRLNVHGDKIKDIPNVKTHLLSRLDRSHVLGSDEVHQAKVVEKWNVVSSIYLQPS